jgi:fumarate reductase iron-sulfur subunit
MAETRTVRFEVTRFRPEEDADPITQSYEVPCLEDWVVLDALNYIKDEIDPTLSHRWSCRMGVCGSCGMSVNGLPKLTCNAFVRDYPGTVRVGPLANFPIVRDLVVDIGSFMEKLQALSPWLIRESEKDPKYGEYLQSPDDLARYKQFSMCINCTLCYAACPVLSHSEDFLGPAAIALAHRYNLDSRDEGQAERFEALFGEHGVWHCSVANECSEVCPKHVDPAAAIQQSKLLSTLQWLRILPKRGAS